MKFHNIERASIENGTGIRVVLWVSGCFHNCAECQNPITHDPNDGVEFGEKELQELIDDLRPDYITGLTLSGGDPLCYYAKDTLDIIKAVREEFGKTKTIWLYTGFTLEELLYQTVIHSNMWNYYLQILKNIDVLVDGRYEKEKFYKDYHWAGSTNQRVIDLPKTIEMSRLVLLESDQTELCSNGYFDAKRNPCRIYLDALIFYILRNETLLNHIDTSIDRLIEEPTYYMLIELKKSAERASHSEKTKRLEEPKLEQDVYVSCGCGE